MAKMIVVPGARPANQDEALVVNYLKEHLPDTYTLIPNIEIVERGRPAFEYDVIVVAPHAIFVVETKGWRGGIRGDDHTWLVAGGHRRNNPWPTANNKARVLRSQIKHRQPACGRFWVEAIIAIADDRGEMDLRGHCRARVFRYTDLPDFLTDASALGGKAGDLRSVRAYIEKAIQEAGHGRTEKESRYGEYLVLETLFRRDQVAGFLARNELLRSDEPVQLRAFSYDPYLPPDELAKRREVIRREAESLQQIGPHPNLITLKGFMTAPDDPNLFLEITEWSEEGTLRALMNAEAPLSLERKLELAQGIAAGLKAAHAAGVIHRDVRPENILIGRDGQPRLMNFDHARLPLSQAGTVSPIRHDPDVPRVHMAPELLDPSRRLTPAADLYGLGMILFEMLTGDTPYDTPEEAQAHPTALGGPAEYVADVPDRLNQLVCGLLHADPQRRPQSADEVLAQLHEIREKPSGTVVPDLAPEPAEAAQSRPDQSGEGDPAVFEVDSVIDGKYRVQKVLDAGGAGRVYKVYDGVFDQVYALKVFEGTAQSLDFLKKEAQSLLTVSHPNIVRVHTWGKLPQSGRFYLVTDFVEGEDLTAYTTPDRRLPTSESVKAIQELLAALIKLHPDVDRLQELQIKMGEDELDEIDFEEYCQLKETGLLHRDIKPANLMLGAQGLMLVDFNIAARASQAGHTYVGTPGYMLPDTGIIPWNVDGDLFATGIVLYELITGHHPYPDRQPNAEDEPTDPRRYQPHLHPAFAELLMCAVSWDPARRFHSARQFRQSLLALEGVYLLARRQPAAGSGPTLERWEVDKTNYNPYVTRFLKLYSQARRDNSGTRGFDEVARLTYVETRLDRMLKPSVLDGQYRLVIITGNAGDGKTAFIQNLESAVSPSAITHPTPNSGTFTYHRVRFVTNYDGSQDEGAERANDQVLTEFFAPFDDDGFNLPPSERTVHVIAINEGRLIDFFGDALQPGGPQTSEGSRFTRLGQAVTRFFDTEVTEKELPDWLLVVDLNQRSVVARDPDAKDTSIFERQLEKLLESEFWQPCQACALRDECLIRFNVTTLADPASGPAVRERLRTLFEIVHLRRQLHITMRDMRSALSWLLFRDHSCEDVARLLEDKPSPQARLSLLYHNAYAADGGPLPGQGDDRLVSLLRQIDPAEMANPTADRSLHFQGPSDVPRLSFEGRVALETRWLDQWQVSDGWQASQDQVLAGQIQARHLTIRRMAFFERRDDAWLEMLPYRYLAQFRTYTQSASPEDLAELKHVLVEGISRVEGAHNVDLARQYVCLRAGQTEKAAIKSFRLFSQADFQIEVPHAQMGHYVECTPDEIVFYYIPREPGKGMPQAAQAKLAVSLDLLELLFHIRDGYTPSLNDIHGFFINLLVFKNALAHLPYRRAVLTRDERRFFELLLQDGSKVTLQPWSGERMLAHETDA